MTLPPITQPTTQQPSEAELHARYRRSIRAARLGDRTQDRDDITTHEEGF